MMSYWEEDEWTIEDEMEDQDSCYYGFGICIDPFCRDVESCVGCQLQTPLEEAQSLPMEEVQR